MRTLVISDLHLGSRLRHDVLSRPEPLRRLIAALAEIDRLVLLGDIVELGEGQRERAMGEAAPVLTALGSALGPRREVIVVPGNHDHHLVASWARAQGNSLKPDSAVPLDASPALARLASWLAPAQVRVHYPGVWLADRVWAMHGHYLDRHLAPESAFGVARGLLGRTSHRTARPIDYELARRPSLTRFTRFLPRPVAALVDDVAELVRASTMPRVPRRLLDPRLAPFTAAVLGLQTMRASVPAIVRVSRLLGIDADWLLFGHVHRLGPLAGDRPSQWQGRGGLPRLANSGSWVYEPLLVHRASPPHPYWPGGALLLEPGSEPRPISLLEDLAPDALHSPPGGHSR